MPAVDHTSRTCPIGPKATLADWTPPASRCAPAASNWTRLLFWKVTSSTSPPDGSKATLAERTPPPSTWAPAALYWVSTPLGETTSSTSPAGPKATLTDGGWLTTWGLPVSAPALPLRSEERRVGKG